MDFQSTDVRLPVKQIRDTNLSWVRRDAEPTSDDDELLQSLRDNGMQLPILLTTELVVADGARRFLRAERLGWREVPVVVTTDWNVVTQYLENARKLEANGAIHDPMTWAEIVDLVAGPLDLLYRRRRLERGRATRAAAAERRARGEHSTGRKTAETDYTAEAADALGWRRSDLKSVRELYWALDRIQAQEEADRKSARREGGAAAEKAVPRRAEQLREEALRLEGDGLEGGLHTLLRKLNWIKAGKDLEVLKTGRAKRRVGDPTLKERKAAAAANAQAVGRELDAQTLTRLTQVLVGLGVEADAYTHLRPSVRTGDARTAARDIRLAVNQINRLVRTIRAFADNLEESS